MVQEKYGVRLATHEKGRLRQMIRAGRSSAQAITRGRILLKIDAGWTAPQVAAALEVSERTVFRTKRRYAEEGLDEVLRHHNQVNRPRKVDEKVEAHPVSSTGQALIALACSPVSDGHDHWTMRALAGKVVELGLVESLSPETVRLRLKKHAQAMAQPDPNGVLCRPGNRVHPLQGLPQERPGMDRAEERFRSPPVRRPRTLLGPDRRTDDGPSVQGGKAAR